MVPELKMFALKLALVLVVVGLLSTVVEVESKCEGEISTETSEIARVYRTAREEMDARERNYSDNNPLGFPEPRKYFYGNDQAYDTCSSRLVLTKDFYRFFR